jgi:hypothetical protein
MLKILFRHVLLALVVLLVSSAGANAGLNGPVNFVVLRVTFKDFPAGTRFTTAQTQGYFNSIAQLWSETSYGNISLHFQYAGPYRAQSKSCIYLNLQSCQLASNTSIVKLVDEAVANSPKTINWSNVYGVVVLIADPRTNGRIRDKTLTSWLTTIHPPAGGSYSVHAAVLGENPAIAAVTKVWGGWAHEIGHQMQSNHGYPWHPSNYNSFFEEMDTEYPAQSGVFEKESNMQYPGWLPPSKYKIISPPIGGTVGLLAEERSPAFQPDYQAIKAFLRVGGPKVYYLISVRHHLLGDNLATVHGPSGIPDEGVLIERVEQGGDPTINDCPTQGKCYRWVNVEGNGNNSTLWHVGQTYHSAADGIYIFVVSSADADHYNIDVRYASASDQPDVGLQDWLQPPGNSYETTDIWFDSPVNGYDKYRYPIWSDLLGGTVPSGNGDDPALGQVNRLWARVRNYGSLAATNVVVHFDITNPPGLGIQGSNGFIPLGSVDKTSFPSLASIGPGQHVDVYYKWKPNFVVSNGLIKEGRFFFHTCVRVRLDHVAGETFFANQDGDGEQENISYFQGGSNYSPGAPGPPNGAVIHLRNDSTTTGKGFYLSVLPESIPDSWSIVVNRGNPVVQLKPNEVRNVPVVVKQTMPEPIGSHHTFRVVASSLVTLRNADNPNDVHEEDNFLGGVQFQIAVLHSTTLTCSSTGHGHVQGTLTGLTSEVTPFNIEVVGVDSLGRFTSLITYGSVPPTGGSFNAFFANLVPTRAVCLFAGSMNSKSAGSDIFNM